MPSARRSFPASKRSRISASSASGKRPRRPAIERKSATFPNTVPSGRKSTRAAICAPGRSVQQFERCFLTLMHQRAVESDIIIVNHHLFFADLALKDDDFTQIIPEYSAVIFDEAHEIEDVIGQYFGISVSSTQLDDLRRDVAAIARMKNCGSAELDRILQVVHDMCDQVLRALRRKRGPNWLSDITMRSSKRIGMFMITSCVRSSSSRFS